MAQNYVDNKQFYQLIKEYQQRRKQNPNERIPESIGQIIILMAKRLATRYNFNAYTFKEEMISDGILRAVEVFNNYDCERWNNPFAYFTKVIFQTYVQRIKKEKDERKKRDNLIMVSDIYTLQEGDDCMITKDQVIGDFAFDSGEW